MRLHFLFPIVFILFADAVISSDSEFKMETLAEGLDHAWGIAVVSNDEILVTEGVGRLRRIIDGQLDPVSIKGIPSVFLYPDDLTQGGLCDVALHPRYDENQLIYLSFGEADKDDPSLNAMTVIRGRLEGYNLIDVKQIFKAEPPRKTAAHYGARMLFLPDGTLLITSARTNSITKDLPKSFSNLTVICLSDTASYESKVSITFKKLPDPLI